MRETRSSSSTGVTNSPNDQGQLVPTLKEIRAAGGLPDEHFNHAGCRSTDKFEAPEVRCVSAYIATGRQKHGAGATVDARAASAGSLLTALAWRLELGG